MLLFLLLLWVEYNSISIRNEVEWGAFQRGLRLWWFQHLIVVFLSKTILNILYSIIHTSSWDAREFISGVNLTFSNLKVSTNLLDLANLFKQFFWDLLEILLILNNFRLTRSHFLHFIKEIVLLNKYWRVRMSNIEKIHELLTKFVFLYFELI